MYQKIGNEIRSARGVLIATLNNGVLMMAPGKKSQEAKVRAFLQENGGTDSSIPEAESGSCNQCTDHADEEDNQKEPSWEDVEAEAQTLFNAQGAKVFVGDVPIEHVETRAEEKPQTSEEWQVSTIPESELPPFDAQLGVNTPGFGEFVSKHKLNKEQVGALIKRICRMKGW